jgi:hypothetical protein
VVSRHTSPKAQPKEEIFGGTGRPFERREAYGVQVVVRLLAVLDDEFQLLDADLRFNFERRIGFHKHV